MFRTLPALLALLMAFAQAQPLPTYLPHQSDLWSYMPLDSSLHDLVKGDTMTAYGSLIANNDRNNQANGAMYTDGTAYGYRNIFGDTAGVNMRPDTAVTMMAWVRPTSTQSYSTVLSVRYNSLSSPYNTLFLGMDASKGKWVAFVSTSDGYDYGVDGSSVALNAWVHLAMTYSAASGKLRIYSNGVEIAATIVSGSIAYTVTPFFALGNAYGPGGHNFVGDIDDAVVYKRALSILEIRQVMAQGMSDPVDLANGLMVHYPFNGDVEDASPNNLDGTLNGTGSYIAGHDSSANSALLLNAPGATNGHVSLPSLYFGANAYSMAAWVRLAPGASAWNNDCALFHFGNSTNANTDRISYGLSYGNGGRAYISHSASTLSATNTDHPADGSWFHVVLIQQNNRAQLYLNGVPTLVDATMSTMSTGTMLHNWIGKTFFDAYANIAIDDFRFYNRALNHSEALALFNGLTGTEKSPAIQPDFSLLPNPATDFVTIETALPVQEVRLLDLSGKTVLTSNQPVLNVANLPAGMYLVQVQTAQGTATRRLVRE